MLGDHNELIYIIYVGNVRYLYGFYRLYQHVGAYGLIAMVEIRQSGSVVTMSQLIGLLNKLYRNSEGSLFKFSLFIIHFNEN